MITQYRLESEQRSIKGIPPLPLTVQQVSELLEMVEQNHQEREFLISLLENRVEPGVGEPAKLKAFWLERVILGKIKSDVITPERAIAMLSLMSGGYCVEVLVRLLQAGLYQAEVASGLKHLTKVYDAFEVIKNLAAENTFADEILRSWARAEWFTAAVPLPEQIELHIYKVDGEINTDDLSPGSQSHTRTDIPLHATFFGKSRFPGGMAAISEMRAKGVDVAFAGDVVGTGSSRKSAVNSLLWHTGKDIPGVPNKRRGGFVLGGSIAPIFYGSARDAGVLPIECDVTTITTGDTINFNPYKWELKTSRGIILDAPPPPATLLDEYRAGGRLSLIIGKNLTRSACEATGIPFPDFFKEETGPAPKKGQGYSLAQKIIGRACGLDGVLPGTLCLPKISTVGSQDTTGPMTMQEIEELACTKFKTDFFLQTFCHTAAYPNQQDLKRWATLQESTRNCGGLALNPGDGVIHSWLNKMLVPDQVGTGGDSHTRFPLGISFPAGSSLIAFAAALGFMPLEMPDSVLVRFHGKRKAGITVRDMVNAIPYFAIQQGLLSVDSKDKKNAFSGTIIEIEGVDDLSVDEAFELSDSSAERSASACTIKLPIETVVEQVKRNITILRDLLENGYQTQTALQKRIDALEEWLKNPQLLSRDDNAEYKARLDINLADIDQPILARPNDPDKVQLLEECAGTAIDEVFIGSCMTHLEHLRSASRLFSGEGYATSRLWVAPTTRLDRETIKQEGSYAVFAKAGARIETPGCSLCMGNQARVKPGSTVFSTSTRNFNNRLGDNTKVYLGSTEIAAMSALRGAIPSVKQYFECIAEKTCSATSQANN
jgi:aconitate hydratase 2/2-methylisocitrate dehydratase